MAEWSRETPWRQGHVVTDEAVDKLALRDAQAPEASLVVVISHDCDLAASPDREPEVELIVGRQIQKADGNFTHAKTPRVLHIEFAAADDRKFVELAATKKVRVAKELFADHQPRQEFQLGPAEQSILQRWLGARYRRSAFPDAFEKRLDSSGADKRLSRFLSQRVNTYAQFSSMWTAATKFSARSRKTRTRLRSFWYTQVSPTARNRRLLR